MARVKAELEGVARDCKLESGLGLKTLRKISPRKKKAPGYLLYVGDEILSFCRD